MHLEQRSDGDGTGMKITWRNGGFGEGEPGDHVVKVDPAVPLEQHGESTISSWSGTAAASGFRSMASSGSIEGIRRLQPYSPPNHRISLGCYPRAESFPGAIYKNVKLRQL